MNKSLKLVIVGPIFIVLIAAAAIGAFSIANSLSDSGKVSTKCQEGQHHHYDLVIKNDKFSPNSISATRCDTLTIKNLDNRGRLIAFGKHEAHTAYDGISERYLTKDESFSLTLDKTGSYIMHDHEEEEVKASFTVR
jgi:plastocyanin